jgi:hypothetical protein
MNTNAKPLTVSKSFFILDGVYLALTFGCDRITDVLAWVNRGHDDYELRGIMGEWTRGEAIAEIQAGIDCQEWNRLADEFWSDAIPEGY